jgi:predicted amidohydrolase YtcJ
MLKRKSLRVLLCLLSLWIAAGCRDSAPTADLVLRGGKVVTVDPAAPEVEALAVSGDTIVAVGPDQEIEPYIGPETQVIDLEGKLAIPGFIEGHGHFMGIGDAKLQLQLMGTGSWDEIVAMVVSAVEETEPGEWIRGRGWHQSKWSSPPQPSVEGFPTHHSLSEVSPENPVVLRHASGHASFANAKAMELAGVTSQTPDPPGGVILKDGEGDPIGVFLETAQRLIRPSHDSDDSRERQRAELATQECLSNGITSFQDAGSSFETIDLFKELADEGKLGVRLWVMVRASNDELAAKLTSYRMLNVGDHRLTVRAIKRSIDGALGPRGAWLLEPYSDLPQSTGLNTSSVDDIEETARLAIENDFQLCVHAIGDRGNRETLDLFERTFAASPEKPGESLRWRIEHAQHIHPDDIPRFAGLGVIASMQGIHCTSDAPWAMARLGDRRAEEGAYVWQSLLQSGAVVTNGTDAPVEDVSPIASFYATVSRKLAGGSVFYPDQRMSREEALRSYTLSAAQAAFEEDIKGSLTPGKLADITVLSKDIMTIPEDEIPTTEVLYTIVGGEVMYRKAPATTSIQ